MPTQNIDLGNTDAVTFDGADVDKLTLDGTTIWEKVTIHNGIINQTLDGVIYKKVGSGWGTAENTYILFVDRIRRQEVLDAIASDVSLVPNQIYQIGTDEFGTLAASGGQMHINGDWDSSTKTFSSNLAGFVNDGENLLGIVMSHFGHVIVTQFLDQIGQWTSPTSTGQLLFPDGPAMTSSSRTGYKTQSMKFSVAGYLNYSFQQFWSTSGLDPREVDKPQDMDRVAEANVGGGLPNANVNADGGPPGVEQSIILDKVCEG